MSTAERRRDVVKRLSRRPKLAKVAAAVKVCTADNCGECGDVCPVAARNRRRNVVPKLRKVFREHSGLLLASYTAESWHYDAGELATADLASMAKTVRRALDRVSTTDLLAVCVIDGAFKDSVWKLSVHLIVAGAERLELAGAFRNGHLDLEWVISPTDELKKLLDLGQIPDAPRKNSGEYYAWLARLTSGSRLFRYGLDRHFHPIRKKARIRRPGRGHPNPRWLERYQFGTESRERMDDRRALEEYYRSPWDTSRRR